VNVFDGFSQRTVGSVLCSALTDAAELARHLYDAPTLADIVADRLLDIDILARLHGPNGRQRVPMIRRSDEDGGDRLVVENHTQVLNCFRLRAILCNKIGSHFSCAITIGVADVRNLAVRKLRQFARVLLAANAAADDGYGDFVVGARGALLRRDD
jgi:hypothetical protein